MEVGQGDSVRWSSLLGQIDFPGLSGNIKNDTELKLEPQGQIDPVKEFVLDEHDFPPLALSSAQLVLIAPGPLSYSQVASLPPALLQDSSEYIGEVDEGSFSEDSFVMDPYNENEEELWVSKCPFAADPDHLEIPLAEIRDGGRHKRGGIIGLSCGCVGWIV